MRTVLDQIILVIAVIFVSSAAFAQDGTVGGGGGSDSKRKFVEAAEALISRLDRSDAPESKKYAMIFRNTLSNPEFKMDVVDKLIDPATGLPVPNQRPLYAYGSKNYIQLKSQSSEDPSAGSWDAKVKSGENLDPDICHEMHWAAGLGEDRDYQICVVKLKLNLGKDGVFKISFNRFAYAVPSFLQQTGIPYTTECIKHFESGSWYNRKTYCETWQYTVTVPSDFVFLNKRVLVARYNPSTGECGDVACHEEQIGYATALLNQIGRFIQVPKFQSITKIKYGHPDLSYIEFEP